MNDTETTKLKIENAKRFAQKHLHKKPFTYANMYLKYKMRKFNAPASALMEAALIELINFNGKLHKKKEHRKF